MALVHKIAESQFHSLIWLLIAFSFVLITTQTTQSKTTTVLNATKIRNYCPKKCGNLTIPYPFGIGEDCAMGAAYVLECVKIGHVDKVFFLRNLEIIEISDSKLRISGIAGTFACIPNYRNYDDLSGLVNLTGLPYAYSHSDNKIMILGCHHYGYLIQNAKTTQPVHSCVTLCIDDKDLSDRTCSGRGCCQIDMPKGVQSFTIWLERVINPLKVISSGKCTYALIGETSALNERPAAIDIVRDELYYDHSLKLPFKLDWFVANKTCKEAQKNSSSYACQNHAVCVDLTEDLGLKAYRCRCRKGFEGNPYLAPGCTDVNECEEQGNPCSHNCTNILGSYICSCPKGYHGDGRKDGSRCYHRSIRPFVEMGVGIGLGSIVLHLFGFSLFVVARRKKATMEKAKNFKRNGGLLLRKQISPKEGIIGNRRIFSADELKNATDNFNGDRELGKGGQGTVYKGMLSDGSIVAIKKSKIVDQRQLNDFVNEVVILSQINHRNIVKLLGCCLETAVPLLVYEYIPNGTLYKLIHEPSDDFPVTWELRLQIATDVAGALAYLHSSSSNPIFHRDVKTENILLDAKYRAKVSDFGTSRSIDVEQTHLTTRIQGTFGYLDPEYFRSSQFTEKSDVYSFGVVLLEVLTGQKAIRQAESPGGKGLVSWFLSAMETSNLRDILATRVANEATNGELLTIANLAKRCLNLDGKLRPTMKEVAWELEVIRSPQDEPAVTERLLPEMIDDMIDENSTSDTSNVEGIRSSSFS